MPLYYYDKTWQVPRLGLQFRVVLAEVLCFEFRVKVRFRESLVDVLLVEWGTTQDSVFGPYKEYMSSINTHIHIYMRIFMCRVQGHVASPKLTWSPRRPRSQQGSCCSGDRWQVPC